jgi:hypothetical protein
MRIHGTIDISEKKPDNEIRTTLIAFDAESDGKNVIMALKSSWTLHGGDKELGRKISGMFRGDTLMLFRSIK